MEEKWIPITGMGERYEVSNLGNVRSYRKNRAYPEQPCPHLVTGGTSNGYRVVRIQPLDSYSPKSFSVHRLVAAAFLPPPEADEVEVHHINHERADNRVENLAWISVAANRRLRKNTGASGYPTQRNRLVAALARIEQLETENEDLHARLKRWPRD